MMVTVLFLIPKSADATEVEGSQIPYAKVIAASFGSLGEAMAVRQSPAGRSATKS